MVNGLGKGSPPPPPGPANASSSPPPPPHPRSCACACFAFSRLITHRRSRSHEGGIAAISSLSGGDTSIAGAAAQLASRAAERDASQLLYVAGQGMTVLLRHIEILRDDAGLHSETGALNDFLADLVRTGEAERFPRLMRRLVDKLHAETSRAANAVGTRDHILR